MNLTLRDAASALQVTENTVLRWISEKNLPAQQVGGSYYVNRVQLLEWASVNRRPLTGDAFRPNGTPLPRLDDALRAGRIVDNLPGNNLAGVYRALVDALPLSSDQDRDEVYQMFLGRESRGSTAIGEGLALPHPRHPIVAPGHPPSITICFLAHPLDLNAPDRQPVHTLLALMTPTVRVHVHLLARLVNALREPGFRAALLQKDPTAIRASDPAGSCPMTFVVYALGVLAGGGVLAALLSRWPVLATISGAGACVGAACLGLPDVLMSLAPTPRTFRRSPIPGPSSPALRCRSVSTCCRRCSSCSCLAYPPSSASSAPRIFSPAGCVGRSA